MELKVRMSFVLLLILINNEFGGVMVVQGRSRGRGGSSSSSSGSHSSSSFLPGTSSATYSRPMLTRNYGGYSGRQSTSGSGYGLGELSSDVTCQIS